MSKPLNETDKNSLFDFKNDGIYIDVKRRRVTKRKYPDTMVGENKVVEGFKLQTNGYRVLDFKRPKKRA